LRGNGLLTAAQLFPAEEGCLLPAPQPYPQQQVARNFSAFPAGGGTRSATFPRGEQTAIPLHPGAGMNRLSTAIDFIDKNMPEIYLIYISYRTIFATATRKNNTNI
jgi:hypothetical protein